MEELGARYPNAVVSLVAPDGFPFSVRVPVEVDRAAQRLRLGGAPVGVPWQPGLACVTAHDHSPDFTWQRNFQVRGDLVEEDGAWAVIPRKLVGGFELPPGVAVARTRLNFEKFRRFRRIAEARAGGARRVAPRNANCPSRGRGDRETRTSRLRCALVEPKPTCGAASLTTSGFALCARSASRDQ